MSGFQITWRIENGSLPDLKEFVSRELFGSVSTPGLGADLPSTDYNKKRHEYIAVIDLPYNITDDIGDGALVVEVDVVNPLDNQSADYGVELLAADLHYEYSSIERYWKDSVAFCTSRGGHLASVSSPYVWQRLEQLLAEESNDAKYIWLGGTDKDKEGEWTWTDGSRWSEEHWGSLEPSDDSDDYMGDEDFLQLQASTATGWKWTAAYDFKEYPCICQLQTKMTIREKTRLVFTSQNISSLQFTWATKPGNESLRQKMRAKLVDSNSCGTSTDQTYTIRNQQVIRP